MQQGLRSNRCNGIGDSVFYNLMPHETQEDYLQQVEVLEDLSKNIMQAGKPVLWTMAGNLDKLNSVYNRRFYSDVFCLALVCEEETHTSIHDMPFDICDTEGKDLNEAAEDVKKWITEKMLRYR